MFKTYLKCYGYLIISIIFMSLILSILSYLFNKEFIIIKNIIPYISLLISSIILGKNSNTKAYLEGIKFSIIYLIISFILNIIFKYNFNYKLIIYYMIILMSSITGATIGINIKKKSE